MGKQGQGLMETDGGLWPNNRWGVCLDAHRVLVLALNIEAGTDAQVP